jgi:fatty acid desaturase
MNTTEKALLIEQHQPHWSSAWVWVGFFAAFLLLEALLAWTLAAGPFWLCAALILMVGYIMHAHLIAFHETAHHTLCPNRWCNDAIGMFIGTLSFMGFSLYRCVHHTHHAYLATERDEELWPFVVPGTPRWARLLAALAELVLGIAYTPCLFLRSFLRSGSPVRDPQVRRRVWLEFALMAVVWSAIVAAVAWWNAWMFLVFMYVVPGIFAGFLQSLRKYIEHMGLEGSTPLSSSRSVVSPGPLGRFVAFSLFNIPYHGVHHQLAALPQSRMPHYTALLQPTRADELPPFPSYRHALRDMARSLADPHVGVQWREESRIEDRGPKIEDRG